MPLTAGEYLAQRKFNLTHHVHVDENEDALCTFMSGANTAVVVKTIQAGTGITIANTDTNLTIALAPINGIEGSYKNPTRIRLNKYGQIMEVVEKPPDLSGTLTISDLSGYPDVTFVPRSVSAKFSANSKKWSGRWRSTEKFTGPVKLSFMINAGVSFVGLSRKSDISGAEFLRAFDAGFYFESAQSYGILDNTDKQKYNISGLFKQGSWSPTDTFSIIFDGRKITYYRNDIQVHTEYTISKMPLYVAGAFLISSDSRQVITNLVANDVSALYPALSVPNSMKYEYGGSVTLIDNTEITVVQTVLNTSIDGNISVWGNVDVTGSVTLGLSISHLASTSIIASSRAENSNSIFLGTSEYCLPGLYQITMTAKGPATILSSRIMAMGNLV